MSKRDRIRVMAGLHGAVDKAKRRIAYEVWSQLDLATPVYTGRARANNMTQEGTPFRGEIGSPGDRSVSNAEARAAAEAVLIAVNEAEWKTPIHISNNLPYIQRLNDGWSAQAPAAFVEQAIARGVAAAERGGGR